MASSRSSGRFERPARKTSDPPREIVPRNRITFSSFIDADMRLAQGSLGVRILPEMLLIATDGRLVTRVTGSRHRAGRESVAMLPRGNPLAVG